MVEAASVVAVMVSMCVNVVVPCTDGTEGEVAMDIGETSDAEDFAEILSVVDSTLEVGF